MAKTTKPGAEKAPKPAPKAVEAPVEAEKAADPGNPPGLVAEAKAVFDGLDERERTARALNCLLHGHPAGIVVDTGGSGVFCPHCCTWLAEPGV